MKEADAARVAVAEVIAIGWSPARGGFVGREYVQQDPARGFIADAIASEYSSPWDASLPQKPDFSNRIAMTTYARLQVQLLRHKVPGAVAGGRFVVAELTPERIKMDACELSNRSP